MPTIMTIVKEQPHRESEGSYGPPSGPRFSTVKSRPPLLPQHWVQTPLTVGVSFPQCGQCVRRAGCLLGTPNLLPDLIVSSETAHVGYAIAPNP